MDGALERALERIERGQAGNGPWHVLWVVVAERMHNRLYVPPKRLLRDGMVAGHDTLEEARSACGRDLLHVRFDAWLLNVETGETELVARRRFRERGEDGA